MHTVHTLSLQLSNSFMESIEGQTTIVAATNANSKRSFGAVATLIVDWDSGRNLEETFLPVSPWVRKLSNSFLLDPNRYLVVLYQARDRSPS